MKTCLLCGRGTLKLKVHMRNTCPKVHSAHLPLCVGHTAAHCSPLFMSTDLSWKKNLGEQGIEVLPCLLGGTTGIRNIGVASCPDRELLKVQFSKALQWPPRVSLQFLRALCAAALKCCSYNEAFLSVLLSVSAISLN